MCAFRLARVTATATALTFAGLSATAAAVSASLQHQAADLVPLQVTGAFSLLRHLAQRPLWLLGQLVGVLTVVFHALALHFGPITLVQPLVVSGIVLAVPLRAAMAHRLPGAREMAALFLAAVGIAVFLVVSAPSAGKRAGLGATSLLLITVCIAVAGVALMTARRVPDPTRRAFLLGGASGVFFALVAVLLKMSLDEFAGGGVTGVLGTWPVYALLIAGVGGILGNQLAYRSARLSSSMPVLNVVDVLLALTFGYVLFHEIPRHSAGSVVPEALALLAMMVGLWSLAQDAAKDSRTASGKRSTAPDLVT
jgi:drug/metabolite transporter (DMT)-like permease